MKGYMRSSLVRVAVSLLMVGSGLVGTVHAASSDTSTPAVDAARLRVTISTTSSWAQVRFSPGSIVADYVVDQKGQANYSAGGDTISLRRVVGQATVTTKLVLKETTGASSFTIDVGKGFTGRADVTITNTNAEWSQVASISDTRQDPTDTANRVDTTVSRDQLMTTTPLGLPKAGQRPLVLAAYYPWFANYKGRHLADRPTDPRSVWNPDGVLSMTKQAASAGIDGFVVSWHGENADGEAMDRVQHAAVTTGQVFTAYLEVPSAQPVAPTHNRAAQVRDWLVQALSRRRSPAFLKSSDGIPVVFVYGMAHLSPSQWRSVLVGVGKQRALRVHLVGDTLSSGYRQYEWGVHRYAVLDSVSRLVDWSQSASLSLRAAATVNPDARPTLYAGTVSPGFNDRKLRGDSNPIIRRGSDGQRYDKTWRAALAGDPDWIFVSTWNEWFEDTQVEPGESTGGMALTQTAQHTAAWRSSPH